jgi:hypothetical protein
MDLAFADDGSISLVADRPVTEDGNIDGESPPEWFIPPSDLRSAPTGEPADLATGDSIDAGGGGASTAPVVPAGDQGAPPPG